ncbi:MAG: peptide deformylase [Pirellulales bacterium]
MALQKTLQIIHYPHPTLRHRSKPLKKVDSQLRVIVREMFDLMYEHQGVGLAANQVDLPYRLFVANLEADPESKETEQVFINPVLSGAKGSEEGEEGCLSIPTVYSPVRRAARIKIQAYDLSGEEITAELEGLAARVVQHETDHLDGVLFIDRVAPTVQRELRDKLQEFEIDFESKRQRKELPDDVEIADRLAELEKLRT